MGYLGEDVDSPLEGQKVTVALAEINLRQFSHKSAVACCDFLGSLDANLKLRWYPLIATIQSSVLLVTKPTRYRAG